jgi:NADH dehydrogenase [ubiquinone] 1 alpha subcomplex assembly factor 5
VATDLFDMRLRAARRDRALRSGPVQFLHEQAFAEVLERLGDIKRDFSAALLVGAADPSWPGTLGRVADKVTAIDPGAGFAAAAGGSQAIEDRLDLDPASYDLCIAAGTLDSVNDLPGALLRLRLLLKPDSLLIGYMSGGETLPRLRQAMRAADAASREASPHVHPRVEPSALAHLLTAAGFEIPVVDVERLRVSYRSFRQLVADLRGMGATNVLNSRSRKPLTRDSLAAAERDFRSRAEDSRTVETFELLHFAAWTPAADPPANR